VAVVALFPALLVGFFIRDRHQREARDRSLAYQAHTERAALDDYFARARALTSLLSQNPAFRHFYEAPGARAAKVRAQIQPTREAQAALAYLETLFPSSIGEACFIDAGGAENARAVRGQVAPLSELSPDETGAPFFAPTFALPPGAVFQSLPYVSPDTKDTVIANSTAIPMVNGTKPAIVHFEIALESFRQVSSFQAADADLAIVDADTGRVILGGKHGELLPTGMQLGARAEPAAGHGHFMIGKHRASFEAIAKSAHNQNHWLVVAVSHQVEKPFLTSLGVWQLVLLGLLLVLVVLAALNWRAERVELDRAANSDVLTGLSNRRRLMTDIESALQSASEERPLLLAFFDLDGFKAYNDMFGHPAGDALLARLGERLCFAVSGRGHAYRMGGDEFCLLARVDNRAAALELVATASEALSAYGEGFTITSSWGAAVLPEDAVSAEEALHLVDERMYAQKASSRASASAQTANVLMRVVSERYAELGDHLSEVAALAEMVGRRLGLPDEEIVEICRAASLHDIGTVAIPQAILGKAGPLSPAEWEFIRQHPLIGERIMGAAPALARAAKLVRASHECWDGSGYPDCLRGDEIPLGARIIAVCDAYEAMTSDRPYHPGLAGGDALAELRRCAGKQFDPAVVEAFAAEIERSGRKTASDTA
jgi:diguanylate cyclase (GGDEF)-like protein